MSSAWRTSAPTRPSRLRPKAGAGRPFGRGWLVQRYQLCYGHARPALRDNTLAALAALEEGLLRRGAAVLREGYCFRRLRNLTLRSGRQSALLPEDGSAGWRGRWIWTTPASCWKRSPTGRLSGRCSGAFLGPPRGWLPGVASFASSPGTIPPQASLCALSSRAHPGQDSPRLFTARAWRRRRHLSGNYRVPEPSGITVGSRIAAALRCSLGQLSGARAIGHRRSGKPHCCGAPLLPGECRVPEPSGILAASRGAQTAGSVT